MSSSKRGVDGERGSACFDPDSPRAGGSASSFASAFDSPNESSKALKISSSPIVAVFNAPYEEDSFIVPAGDPRASIVPVVTST